MLCRINMNRYGHLEVEPVSGASSRRLREEYSAANRRAGDYYTNLLNDDEPLIYLQLEDDIEAFLDYVFGSNREAMQQREELASGYEMTEQVDTDYLYSLIGLS